MSPRAWRLARLIYLALATIGGVAFLPPCYGSTAKDAEVPLALQGDSGYCRYAEILIQLDLLAKPSTASLPITVDAPKPGLLRVSGVAPTSHLKSQIVASARRISGLP